MTVGRIVAIGEGVVVRCYGLAGAGVLVAEDSEAAVAAWSALPPDVVLAILTPRCAAMLAGRKPPSPALMQVVIGE